MRDRRRAGSSLSAGIGIRTCRIVAGGLVGALFAGGSIVGSSAPVAGVAPSPTSQPIEIRGADFDGDGHADLVLTGADDTEDVARPVIQVMYGGVQGLSERRMQDLELQELVPPRPEGLGASSGLGGLTTGDFDGDGYSDLAIGIRALEVAGVREAGGVLLLRGSTHGLVEQAWQLITQASPGVSDRPEKGDGFGSSLAAANLGRGPEDDLVIGIPLEDLQGGVTEGGQVHVLYGSTQGVDLATSEVWRQSSPGIDGRASDHDRWSTTLATGDFDGSSYADLAIGSTGRGTVHVLYGSARGLTPKGSQRWSATMPILAARGDIHGFSDALASGDFDADGYEDLALSSGVGPRFDTGGSVAVLYGSRVGLTAARAQTWSQDSLGIADSPGDSEWFGLGLTVGSFGRDSVGRTYADLAVGVTESIDAEDAGAVHIIFGGPLGLTGSGSQLWSQSTPGVPGKAEYSDEFGRVLVSADFGRNPRSGRVDDLAVISIWDVIDGTELTGALTVLYGNQAGLTAKGSNRWDPVDFGLARSAFGYMPESMTS